MNSKVFQLACLTVLLASTACLSVAQDYALFRNTGVYYYHNNTTQEITAYHIDSVVQSGNTEIYFNYRSMKGDDIACRVLSYGFPGTILKTGNTWTMVSDNADFFSIHTDAAINDPWVAYTYANGDYIEAQISNYSVDSVLGATDSVMTVTFATFDGSNNQISAPINTRSLRISKNHGLVSGFGFQGFPLELTDLELAGGSQEQFGIRRLPQQDIFFREVGDIFHYSTSSGYGTFSEWSSRTEGWRKEEVLSKTTVGGIVKLKTAVETWIKFEVNGEPGSSIISGLDTVETDENTSVSPISVQLPHQTHPTYATSSNDIEHWSYDREDWTEVNGRLFVTSKSNIIHLDSAEAGGSCFAPVVISSSMVSESARTFSEGLGRTYFYSRSGDGAAGFNYSFETLEYYKKGTEEWGQVVGVDDAVATSPNSSVLVFPNPVSDQLTIRSDFTDYQHATAETYSLDGKLLRSEALQDRSVRMDVADMENGIYLLYIRVDQSVSAHKFVVQH